MNMNIKHYIAAMLLLVSIANVNCKGQEMKNEIRKAVFADQFYPGDPDKLKMALKDYFADAVVKNTGKPVAVIVPHAGYIYSGQIAADAYNQARNYKYGLVIILGTNHTTGGFNNIGVYPGSAFETPLGKAEVDKQAAEQLIKSDEDCVYSSEVHAREHSIEVQLPFIQYLFPGVKILPMVVGTTDIAMCKRFGKILAEAVKDKNPLIVASSDLSHYPQYDDAVKTDKNTLRTITEMDPQKFSYEIKRQMSGDVSNLVTCACGEGPIIVAMAASKELGASGGSVISYANSGDNIVGNKEKVVGYGAVVFSNVKEDEPTETKADESGTFELSDSNKKALLGFARKSIEQYLSTGTVPAPRGFDPLLERKMGAFVTLRKHKELRGCIGYMMQDLPLCRVVGAMALQAALNDSRFMPVTPDELRDIEIEISVLTPYKAVKSADEIEIGRDGVLLKKGGRQAVFLPQVAAEMGWDKKEFLENLCRKAGLPPDSWRDAQLFTFQAKIFEESEFK